MDFELGRKRRIEKRGSPSLLQMLFQVVAVCLAIYFRLSVKLYSCNESPIQQLELSERCLCTGDG